MIQDLGSFLTKGSTGCKGASDMAEESDCRNVIEQVTLHRVPSALCLYSSWKMLPKSANSSGSNWTKTSRLFHRRLISFTALSSSHARWIPKQGWLLLNLASLPSQAVCRVTNYSPKRRTSEKTLRLFSGSFEYRGRGCVCGAKNGASSLVSPYQPRLSLELE
jgi:hypothetical protein